jgi:hypothetical protein
MSTRPHRSNLRESAHLAPATLLYVLGQFRKSLAVRSYRARRDSEDRMLSVIEQGRLLLGLRLNPNPRTVISSVRA